MLTNKTNNTAKVKEAVETAAKIASETVGGMRFYIKKDFLTYLSQALNIIRQWLSNESQLEINGYISNIMVLSLTMKKICGAIINLATTPALYPLVHRGVSIESILKNVKKTATTLETAKTFAMMSPDDENPQKVILIRNAAKLMDSIVSILSNYSKKETLVELSNALLIICSAIKCSASEVALYYAFGNHCVCDDKSCNLNRYIQEFTIPRRLFLQMKEEQTNKTSGLSPKIEIINHFDNLINRIDIEIETCLLKYSEEKILGDLVKNEKDFKFSLCFHLCFFAHSLKTNQNVKAFPKKTKIIDYLNQVRKRTIDELRNAQKDSIEYYNSVSSHFKKHDQLETEEIRSQLFGDNFYFQILYKSKEEEEWIYSLYTIVTDFYMTSADITFLEKMINAPDDINLLDSYSDTIIFDEKMILIGLIQKCFFENMNNTQEPPNHLIRVSRQDIFNIRHITCHYAMSGVNLTYLPLQLERLVLRGKKQLEEEEIKIENISSLMSLELKLSSFERITLRSLIALQELKFELVEGSINSDIQEKLFVQLPNVQKLTLIGNLSNFNLDNIIHLQELSLKGLLHQDFNYEIFENLGNQLTDLSINCSNIDNERMNKLFIHTNFPNLLKLSIMNTEITKLGNKIFSGFQKLRELTLCDNKELKVIDYGCFSDLKQLTRFNWIDSSLDAYGYIGFDKTHFSELINLEYLKLNGIIMHIEENMFSNLKNLTHLDLNSCGLKNHQLNAQSFFGLEKLKILDLKDNKLTNFDLHILDNLPQIKIVDLSYNVIDNKIEILNWKKDSKVEFKFSFM